MDEDELKLPCLYNFVDLQRLCESQNVQLSTETNRYMLSLTFKKIGPTLSQKLIQKLVKKGEVKWQDDEDFEVEAILDFVKEEVESENDQSASEQSPQPRERHLYLVKWKGWSHEHNTWEPKEHLIGSQELLDDFHCRQRGTKRKISLDHQSETKKRKVEEMLDLLLETEDITPLKLLQLSGSPSDQIIVKAANKLQGLAVNGPKWRKAKVSAITNKRTKAHKIMKQDTQAQLAQWEKHINDINTDPAPIVVENLVDLEGPPTTFIYINDYKPMKGIDIPLDPIVGCECTDCYDEKKTCCGPNAGTVFGYYKTKRVRIEPGVPIYECNKRCKCGPDCCNRVVQNGRKHKVCIFRTDNCRGWGVKALQKIPRGSFVMEYVGEVITFEEAERRGKIYDAEGMTYLFDLDYNDGDCPFTVDARTYGNVSHFVNHSCDPNLVVYGVWINHLDHRLPRIALFAKRDIAKGEELTFDYMMTGAICNDSFNEAAVEEMEAEMETESTTDAASNKGEDQEGNPKEQSTPLKENKDPSAQLFTDKNLTGDSPSTPLKSESCQKIRTPLKVSPSKINTLLRKTPQKNNEDIDQKKTDDGFVVPKEVQKLPLKVDIPEENFDIMQSMPPTPSESNFSEDNDAPLPDSRPKKRHDINELPGMKYRIRCQCGSQNCRQWLY